MKEIDWSKAPKGTTHYLPMDSVHSACWIRRNADETLSAMYADGTDTRWGPGGHYSSKETLLVPRPSAWTGEGLPPVGVACEVENDIEGGWDAVDEVLAHTEIKGAAVAVFKRDDRVFYSPSGKFRPSRSPEQIAAEELKAAIDEMSEVTQGAHDWLQAFQKLHLAGYRKVTP